MIADAICESVAVAGSVGAPGGVLYAALMAHGCSLNQFESMMSALVCAGRLTKRSECYFVKTSGVDALARAAASQIERKAFQ